MIRSKNQIAILYNFDLIRIYIIGFGNFKIKKKFLSMAFSGGKELVNVIINSVDRISGERDNFIVQFNPVLNNIKRVSLQKVEFPFSFNNVTTTYGNSLTISLTTTYGTTNIGIQIPNGFYTTTELITAINTVLQNYFSTVSVPSGGNVSPFNFTYSSIPNRVQLDYNASVWTGSPVSITFIVGATPLDNHIFRMLGLDDYTNTTFTCTPAGNTNYQFTFAHPATINIPISALLINIAGLPSKVLTSSQNVGTFYVDVTRQSYQGQSVYEPNTYNSRRDYYNELEVAENLFSFQQLRVSITDSRGYSVLTDQNVTNWSMTLLVEQYPHQIFKRNL